MRTAVMAYVAISALLAAAGALLLWQAWSAGAEVGETDLATVNALRTYLAVMGFALFTPGWIGLGLAVARSAAGERHGGRGGG